MSDPRPNILVIMSDQHNKHFLGCYGNEIVRTPNLNRLAGEGMRFEGTYCPAPLCVPSRMSFMTSRTPSRNQVWGNFHILSSSIPTWAHCLGIAGYETALVGRMHFSGPDQRHGFEKRPFAEFGADLPGTKEGGTKFPSGQGRNAIELVGKGLSKYLWFDEKVCNETIKYLREKSDSDATRPFAAVSGYLLPHLPFVVPPQLFDHYYSITDIPPIEETRPATVRRFADMRGYLNPGFSDEEIRKARAAYYGLCDFFDQQVGRILTCLKETGLAENTLVIYTSDHGEMAGEHGIWTKSNYYEGSAGIPMIARLPGKIPAGSISKSVCSLMDLGPTFADYAGAQEMKNVDGCSLRGVLEQTGSDKWKDETFSEFVEEKYTGDTNFPSRMIRSGPWKLWLYADDANLPPSLFNLKDDPQEVNDLGTSPEYEQIRIQLLEKLQQNWEPQTVRQKSLEQTGDYQYLVTYGKSLKPEPFENIPQPPVDLEENIELL